MRKQTRDPRSGGAFRARRVGFSDIETNGSARRLDCACRAASGGVGSFHHQPPSANLTAARPASSPPDAPDAGGPTLCNQPCGSVFEVGVPPMLSVLQTCKPDLVGR